MPHHPDYKRVQDALDMQNAGTAAPDDPHFLAVVNTTMNEEAMLKVARERVDNYLKFPPNSPMEFDAWLVSIWVDAFTTGVMYQRSGGHQDDPAE